MYTRPLRSQWLLSITRTAILASKQQLLHLWQAESTIQAGHCGSVKRSDKKPLPKSFVVVSAAKKQVSLETRPIRCGPRILQRCSRSTRFHHVAELFQTQYPHGKETPLLPLQGSLNKSSEGSNTPRRLQSRTTMSLREACKQIMYPMHAPRFLGRK